DKRLKETLDATTDGIWIWNFKLNEMRFSPKYYKMLGYEPDEFPACYENWEKLIHPDDYDNTISISEEWLHEKLDNYENEFRMRCKNGTYLWIHSKAKVAERDENGDAVLMIGNHENITERKQLEEGLRKSEQFLASLFESAQDGISVLKPDLTIHHVNKVMNEWYKKNLPLEGKKCFEVYRNADKPCNPCPSLRCLKSGSTEKDVVPGFPGSSVEWIELFSYPIKDQSLDKVTGVVEYARNITEQKQTQERLMKYHKDLKKLSSQLINVQEAERRRISQELHDEIGQALTAISINLATYCNELQSDTPSSDRERLTEAIELVNGMLDQVQEMSLNLRPPMLDDLGLTSALRWHVTAWAKRQDINAQFKAVGIKRRPNPEIETAIYRIVQEALTNISKHAKANNVGVYFKQKKSTHEIIIEDDGVGFDVETVAQRPPEEHGIGLLGMRERALVLGGLTKIDSQSGMGTRITVSIPLGNGL
ncbi:MAG: PAS domain-containing protein, partial [Methanosarcinaceae archaeon]|nr:PAS domain-containing protein [Methanosarcinaceae archaeon]